MKMLSDGTILRNAPLGFWMAPREFADQTVFVIGGGSSLSSIDPERLREKRIIATNEAGLTLTPWADVLFWADKRWRELNLSRLNLHTGAYKVTRGHWQLHGVHTLKTVKGFKPPREPWEIGGRSSGEAAVQLAVHMGADRVVLLGFDMTPGHFHDKHKWTVPESTYATFIDSFNWTAEWCKTKGVEVLNATPNSALTCFTKVDLDDLI